MQIYNAHLLNNKQRFYLSLLYAILTGIGCSILWALIVQLTHIRFSIFYLFTGYAIAKAIHAGKGGIGKQYSYMAAIVMIFSILFTEMFITFGFSILLEPTQWFYAIRFILNIWSSFGANNILTIFFMIWGIYIAYVNADIQNM